MSLPLLLLVFHLFYPSNLFLLSSANSSITLSLSRVAPPPSTTDNPWDNLKNPNPQLYPHNYGEYTVTLGFGTPPHKLSFIVDTSSSLVWFPCTHKYTCNNCSTPKGDPTFIPKSSSSYKNVTCNTPQCRWVSPVLKCKNHTQPCRYIVQYGSTANTRGLLVSESLTIPGLSVAANFTAGCSFSSNHIPEGIVGFGRGPVSLPSQLGLKAFSYCMVSHEFDDYDPTVSSALVLTTAQGGYKRPYGKIQYTEFVSNPATFPDFYYVWLQNISIGGVDVKVPAKYLVLDAKGNGGTIVDSGTNVTLMAKPVFDLVFKELKHQVGNKYTRARDIEQDIGLEPCYNVGFDSNKIKLPQLTLHFQGGAEMILPLDNYFSYIGDSPVVCMTIKKVGEVRRGPATILANYQQQNYYMEYDLENNRLGILHHKCIST